MKILESDLRKLVRAELRESFLTEASGPIPFKSHGEGNDFREWVNDNHPEYARSVDLDPEGPFNNRTIVSAWNKYGEEYIAAQSGLVSRISDWIFGEEGKHSDFNISRDRSKQEEDYFTSEDEERKVGLLKRFAELVLALPMSTAGRALPWGLTAFLYFVGLRESEMEITSNKYTDAMYWVCRAAQRRGSNQIRYRDYQGGQKLAGISDPAPSHASNNPSGAGAIGSYNPYTAMSVVIGQAPFQGDSRSGYLIRDRYNFDLDRAPGIIEKAEDYIFSVPNVAALVQRITGGEVGGGATGALEEILVMYEVSLNYNGYKYRIQTRGRDQVEGNV